MSTRRGTEARGGRMMDMRMLSVCYVVVVVVFVMMMVLYGCPLSPAALAAALAADSLALRAA